VRQLALSLTSMIAAIAVACGVEDREIPCLNNSTCNRFAGGECSLYEPSGQTWCTYPDENCASERRWSDLDVGDGLEGQCVAAAAVDGAVTIDSASDAETSIDGGPDAPVSAPTVDAITVDERVAPGASVPVVCDASDSDGDSLTYAWEATAGDFVGVGSEVTWRAPSTETAATIRCTVSDGTYEATKSVSTTVIVFDGLVAAYHFQGDGLDDSGNGHDATVPPNMTFVADRFGDAGGALQFDGVNDVMTLPDESSFDLGTVSIVAIVKISPSNDLRGILGKGTTAGGQFSLRVIDDDATTSAGKLGITWQTGPSASFSTFSPNALPQNIYLHIAVVRSTTSVSLYIDGTLATQASHNGTFVANDNQVTIGRNTSTTAFFKGAIDEVRFYDRVLTANEISTLYNGTL
jgi:concanavalin A-like lectin/glucanase superfamily protein